VYIIGPLVILLGLFSIITNKRGAESYAEFQKGWGLQGNTALLVGRLLCIFGGLFLIGVGLLMILG